ncbi:hypothetical protein [Pseudomonas violetae]|nr:hypothetical protein [Pseudomonas violetae]
MVRAAEFAGAAPCLRSLAALPIDLLFEQLNDSEIGKRQPIYAC